MITQEKIDGIDKLMEHNGYIKGQTYGYKLGADWVSSSATSNSEDSTIWWKDSDGSHEMPLWDLPTIPDGMIYEPLNFQP